MNTVEKIVGINEVLKEIFNFIKQDNEINSDFSEYLNTIGASNLTSTQMEKLFIPYIFERYIGKPAKNIIELFNEKYTSHKPEIAKSLLNSQYTIFQIKRLLKNGFKLYNMTNEKEYEVISLTKMTTFRGLGIGNFIIARIFNIKDEYYLIGIDNVISPSQEEDAKRYAIAKIVQAPWLVYQDNLEKEEQIKQTVSDIYNKFLELYKTDEVITINTHADNIVGQLSEDEAVENFKPEEHIKPVNNYKFFEVKELDNNYNNFIENSVKGFSSHKEEYDVGIIMDKEFGVYTIPFYKTFCAIFEGEKVENKSECIKYFLNNDSISANIIKRVAHKYNNFIEIINDELKEKYTIDTLIEEYKSDFTRYKIYSPTCVLLHSNIFSSSIELLNDIK